jgi:hypothetical protein
MLSIACVLLVTLLVTYIYSIFGMVLFQKNDPHHFDTVAHSMLSMIRCATLEDWTDLFYIAYYGCAVYDGERYITQSASRNHTMEAWQSLCEPNPQPGVAVVFFFSYVIALGYVMLSMFIGSISIAMQAQNKQLLIELEEENKQKSYERARKKTAKRVAINHLCIDKQNRHIKLRNCLQKAFYGKDAELTEPVKHKYAVMRAYLRASKVCRKIQTNMYFNGGMALVIMSLGLCMGLSMDSSWNDEVVFRAASKQFTSFAISMLWVVGLYPPPPYPPPPQPHTHTHTHTLLPHTHEPHELHYHQNQNHHQYQHQHQPSH